MPPFFLLTTKIQHLQHLRTDKKLLLNQFSKIISAEARCFPLVTMLIIAIFHCFFVIKMIL
ncbi:hypothetical protein AYY18_12325 [Morganella psychrotolerans]|uniref:Uncharacterized protein n=1 Tax=Morganella psychrotolerans TaxID=368603 RepID=A0A1B8GZB4_9GAMM|nr:hypothetical protein AYY18_12325 [Morganella psychrotolerans]